MGDANCRLKIMQKA